MSKHFQSLQLQNRNGLFKKQGPLPEPCFLAGFECRNTLSADRPVASIRRRQTECLYESVRNGDGAESIFLNTVLHKNHLSKCRLYPFALNPVRDEGAMAEWSKVSFPFTIRQAHHERTYHACTIRPQNKKNALRTAPHKKWGHIFYVHKKNMPFLSPFEKGGYRGIFCILHKSP